MWQELIDTIGNIGTAFVNLWTNAWSTLSDFLMTVPFIRFFWGIFLFVWYAVKSILFLIINLFQSLFYGIEENFVGNLNSVFDGLSVFFGVSTSVLQSLFSLAMLLIVFSFIVRVILGKFHYNVKTKK